MAERLARSEDQISEQLDLAGDSIEQGTTRWRGMTYEQGVDAALRWALGWDNSAPMGD